MACDGPTPKFRNAAYSYGALVPDGPRTFSIHLNQYGTELHSFGGPPCDHETAAADRSAVRGR